MARLETNTQEHYHHRELIAYIYYPSSHQPSHPSLPYDHDALNNAKGFVSLKSKFPQLLLKGWDSLKTYAQPNALIASSSRYPVIIVSHGAAPVVQSYTYLLEELASHGYIVVGINHPYVAGITRYPDG